MYLSQVYDIVEFAGPPKFNQTLWPDHCIQGSVGAELHEDLKVTSGNIFMFFWKS